MKKLLVTIIISCASVVLLLLVAGLFLSPQDNIQPADIIIVVSGGETSRRVDEGIELFKQGWAPYLLFSGAAAEGSVSNAKSMSRVAVSKGVPREQILMDENSKNTLENAKNSKIILERQGFQSAILVTSPYHSRRAGIIFRKVFGEATPIVRRIAPDSRWARKNWYVSSYGWIRTFEEYSGIAYFYLYQRKSIASTI